jgi:hypothetical protein
MSDNRTIEISNEVLRLHEYAKKYFGQ